MEDQEGLNSNKKQEFDDVEACNQRVQDLETQWVNNATTCVIAHYNSAVELEFMSSWKEALVEYLAAEKLSKVAMKANNPMAIKIQDAIAKIKVKVRNGVQLPKQHGQ